MNFHDYEWHDAELKNIVIDRSDPGYNDIIEMYVVWPDDTSARIIFKGVYQAVFNLRFGFIGSETIYTAGIIDQDDPEIIEFYKQWKDYRVKNIKCYVFETAISVSNIKIFAKDFKVVND